MPRLYEVALYPVPDVDWHQAALAVDPVYIVQGGDTLTAIAHRYHMTVNTLAAYNGITDPDLIHTGDRIKVPPANYVAPAPRQAASAPVPPAPTPETSGMGAPGSFQACVAWNESTDGELSSDVYGIEPYIWTDVIGFAGSPYDASLPTQDAAFWRLYDLQGTAPWAPYDGC
jgi:LysM repeat protein